MNIKLKTFHYKCKFCGKPGTVQADESGLPFIGDINKWLAIIACSRCANYMESKRGVMDRITTVLRALETSVNSKDRKEIESVVKEKLDVLTKRFCALVCDYHRVTNVWDRSVPERLFQSPRDASRVISEYVSSVYRESVTRRNEDAKPQTKLHEEKTPYVD